MDKPISIAGIRLVKCDLTILGFDDGSRYELAYFDGKIRIEKDPANRVTVSLIDQQVAYKANLLGGFALSEKVTGKVDYTRNFAIDWIDDMSTPEIRFKQHPVEISRKYSKGQSIELGIEQVSGYRVTYKDGVEAHFDRKNDRSFDFRFSTGFYGSFSELEDGSYSLHFKGDRLNPGEDDYRSQSKFIVSRSKYTGKLLLILQDDADVSLY